MEAERSKDILMRLEDAREEPAALADARLLLLLLDAEMTIRMLRLKLGDSAIIANRNEVREVTPSGPDQTPI